MLQRGEQRALCKTLSEFKKRSVETEKGERHLSYCRSQHKAGNLR